MDVVNRTAVAIAAMVCATALLVTFLVTSDEDPPPSQGPGIGIYEPQRNRVDPTP